MKATRTLIILFLALGLVLCSEQVAEAAEMGMAFTYQGWLMDKNNPADGAYDFKFELFDDPCTGSPQGGTIDINDLEVSGGHFTVELDFGSGVFAGDARWLQITVRPGKSTDPLDFVTLSPRQAVTPTPYALYAVDSGSGDITAVNAGDGLTGGGEYSIGNTGGEKMHRLTINEMPSHTHSGGVNAHHGARPGDDGAIMTLSTTGSSGGDQPHENRPPYYALAFIMKL